MTGFPWPPPPGVLTVTVVPDSTSVVIFPGTTFPPIRLLPVDPH